MIQLTTVYHIVRSRMISDSLSFCHAYSGSNRLYNGVKCAFVKLHLLDYLVYVEYY